jgi:hypothetical protein
MNIEAVCDGFGSRYEGFTLPRIHILEEDYETLADIVCGSASATPGSSCSGASSSALLSFAPTRLRTA